MTVGWDNSSSIYYYRPAKFKDFILGLADHSSVVSDALQDFREVKCLPNRFKQMTVAELRQNDHKQIEELYNSLRNGMRPQSKLALPYSSKAERGEELIDNLAGQYNINRNKAKYKIVTGYYDDGSLNYPYVFEIAAAPYEDSYLSQGGQFDFVGSINSSISADDGHGYFQGGNYSWLDKKAGYTKSASSISEILDSCGFNRYLPISKQKAPCIFIANLECPAISWMGMGKSRIDLQPFARTIAETTGSIASSMPSFHGHGGYGYGDRQWQYKESKDSKKDLLIELLRERWEAVKIDSDLKIDDRWTQSTVWYRLRPTLIENGIEINQGTRSYITSIINDICKEEFGVSREALGIIASARAQMYFDSRWTSVNLDYIESLAEKGTDILFIEKQGVPEVFASFADKYGMALVNTQGHLTEYGKDLVKASKEAGAHAVIITDGDASGITIAAEAPEEIPRIRIDDDDALEYLHISREDVEEEYRPKSQEINPVKKLVESDLQRYKYIDLEYVKHKRIEIDSIVAAVGGERLWEFIVYKLEKLFPTRNYNRVISLPSTYDIYPDMIQKFLSHLAFVSETVTQDEEDKILSELGNVKGFIDVKEKKLEIEDRLRNKLANNKDMQDIALKLAEIIK